MKCRLANVLIPAIGCCVLFAVAAQAQPQFTGPGPGEAAPTFPITFVDYKDGKAVDKLTVSSEEVANRRNIALVFLDKMWAPNTSAWIQQFKRDITAMNATRTELYFVIRAEREAALTWQLEYSVEIPVIWDPKGEIFDAFGVPTTGLANSERPVVVIERGNTIFLAEPALRMDRDRVPFYTKLRALAAQQFGVATYEELLEKHPGDKALAKDARHLRTVEDRVALAEQKDEEARRAAEHRKRLQERMDNYLAARNEIKPEPKLKPGDTAPDFDIPVARFEEGERVIRTVALSEVVDEFGAVVCYMPHLDFEHSLKTLNAFQPKSDLLYNGQLQFIVVTPHNKSVVLEYIDKLRTMTSFVWDPDETIAEAYGMNAAGNDGRLPRRRPECGIWVVGPDREIHYVNEYFDVEFHKQEVREAAVPVLEAISIMRAERAAAARSGGPSNDAAQP